MSLILILKGLYAKKPCLVFVEFQILHPFTVVPPIISAAGWRDLASLAVSCKEAFPYID